ncbi:MAG: hypothetical protein R3E09_03625 [Novosphingobium sp.]|nr:hypothetical protein [Novosphingobium sp.]
MSQKISSVELAQVATATDAPVRTKVDRNFGLPNGLYAATVGLYFGFLAIMTALFMNPELAIPMVLFAGVIIAGFGICGIWATMNPENDTSPLSWGQFANRGIQTLSGHLTASEAAAQVLILPALIVCWGLAIAVIVAFI